MGAYGICSTSCYLYCQKAWEGGSRTTISEGLPSANRYGGRVFWSIKKLPAFKGVGSCEPPKSYWRKEGWVPSMIFGYYRPGGSFY